MRSLAKFALKAENCLFSQRSSVGDPNVEEETQINRAPVHPSGAEFQDLMPWLRRRMPAVDIHEQISASYIGVEIGVSPPLPAEAIADPAVRVLGEVTGREHLQRNSRHCISNHGKLNYGTGTVIGAWTADSRNALRRTPPATAATRGRRQEL